MAKTRKGRPINGILLVDKPLHWTSNQVVQKVKWLFNAQKAGHTGALDPLATGMLPVCLGEATKFSQYLLDADKCYEVTACLGVRTTTSDADGDIVSTAEVNISEDRLRATVEGFKGAQQQVPSMYSALKHEGRPLYYYARKGIDIPRPARAIHLYELNITQCALPYVTLFVRCSKGTYIRSLVDDIGQALGCGAYVTRLHRPSLGQYEGLPMFALSSLEAYAPAERTLAMTDYTALDAMLLPMDAAISHLPSMTLSAELARTFCQGGSVPVVQRVSEPSAALSFRVYWQNEQELQFLGVGETTTSPVDQPATQREAGVFLRPRRVVVYND